MGIHWQEFPLNNIIPIYIIYCRPGRSQVGYWQKLVKIQKIFLLPENI